MDARELKFMLSLLGRPDYRAPIVQVKPNIRTKAAERDRLCRGLSDRGLVDCSEQVVKFRISPAGRALLKLDVTKLPISETELMLLQVGELGSVEVSAVTAAIAPPLTAAAIHAAVDRLISRGLVKAEKTRIDEVWITHRGLEFLRDEFNPIGTALDLSLDHLGEYLRFVRSSLRSPVSAKLSQSVYSTPTFHPGSSPAPIAATTSTFSTSERTLDHSSNQLSEPTFDQMLDPPAGDRAGDPQSIASLSMKPTMQTPIKTRIEPPIETRIEIPINPSIVSVGESPISPTPIPSPQPPTSITPFMVSPVTSAKIAENPTQAVDLPESLAKSPVISAKAAPMFTQSPLASSESQESLGLDRLYQLIVELDRDLRTDNYLPIYHVRDRLQPALSRPQVDQMLYELQRQDRIELSSLQETSNYTPEQINAGIPQDVGGPLFFVVCISWGQ